MSKNSESFGSNDEHANEAHEPHTTEELLSSYLFDELADAERLQVEQALQQDPTLVARLEQLKETLSLLHRSAFDVENGELADERRAALRAAAANAVADTGPGGPTSTQKAGRILQFPVFKVAAAVVAVSAGVIFFGPNSNQWGQNAPNDSTEAGLSRHEMDALQSLGYIRQDGETKELGYVDSKSSLESFGYVDSRGGTEALGYTEKNARDKDRSKRSGAASSPSDEGIKLGQKKYLGGRELERVADLGYVGDADKEEAKQRLQELVMTEATVEPGRKLKTATLGLIQAAESNGGGGAYKGPGDSVALDLTTTGVDAQPNTVLKVSVPETPNAPSTPGTPSTPSSPPPPGKLVVPTLEGAFARTKVRERRSEATTQTYGEALDHAGYVDGLSSDNFGFDSDDLAKGFYFELGGEHTVVICDGYGRYYNGPRVIDYLHPTETDESPRDMFFRYYGDNPYVNNAKDSLSTFAIDVDTASYPLARKMLENQKLPPRAAIRTEEFLNYFDHELAPPREGDFAVELQAAPTPFTESNNNLILKVGIKGREVSSAERKPLNLVFVIDKSGSMRENNRMELVKRSLELLVDQLREDDRVGIVSFDSSGHIVMESTPGAERWKLREAMRQMEPGGSTNAAEGLYLGYEMLSRNYQGGATNRVILASDGVANTGETDQQRILDRIADFTSRQVDLTTIGVGMSNHNDVFLEQMADKGDGACHYVDDFDEAKRIFIDRFTGTMQTIARDMKIQVEFNQEQVARWRQIGYENRSLQDHEFRDDRVDAGEVGAGHEIVALYEVELKSGASLTSEDVLATVRLRWKPDGAEVNKDTGVIAAVEQPFAINMAQIQSDWNKTSPRFRLASVVSQYSEFMRRSYHARGDSYSLLQAESKRLASELANDEQVRELHTLINKTRRLVQFQPPSDELYKLIEESRRLTLLHQELHTLEQRNQETVELMAELQQQNAAIEQRIREHLEGRK